MLPQHKSFDTGKASVQYLEYPGDGPPLLMLHATGFIPWLWYPLARELAASYRVVTPYFYKHREPDPETGALSWGVMAEDFSSLCQGLGMDRPYLVGHSMGGTVSTLATALYGVDTRAMVLMEPIFLPKARYSMTVTVDQHPLASKSINRRNYWESREEARDYLMSNPFFKSWTPEMLELYVEHGMVPGESGGYTLDCQPRQEAAIFLGSNRKNPWPLQSKVTCPILLLEGEVSDNRAFVDQQKIRDGFPNCRYELVNRAGHLIPMERPRKTLELIRGFFQ